MTLRQFIMENLDRVLAVSAMIVATFTMMATVPPPPPKAQANIAAFIDPQTGCHYLGTTGGDAIFPRMDKEGHQICGKFNDLKEN